MTIFV